MWQDALIAIHQRALRQGVRGVSLVAPSAHRPSVERGTAAQLQRVAAVQAAVDASASVAESMKTPAITLTQARSRLLHETDEAYAVTQGMLKLNAQLAQDNVARSGGEAAMGVLSAAAMQYPIVLAAEAAAVMLKAGHVTQATEVLAFWKGSTERSTVSVSQRRAVRRHLHEAIVTLGKLKDVTTLRRLAGVLVAAYHAEQQQQPSKPHIVDEHQEMQISSAQYRLLGVLSTRVLHDLFCDCVATLCKMNSDDEAGCGVSLLEKLTLLSQAIIEPQSNTSSSSRVGPVARRGEGTAWVQRHWYLPLKLQHVFAEYVESEAHYSEELVQQVCPQLLQAFVPPARLDLLQLLTMSTKEVRWACAMWTREQRALALEDVQAPFDSVAPQRTSSEPSWSLLLHKLMQHSRRLVSSDGWHAMQLNALLLTLRESSVHQNSLKHAAALDALRTQLVRDGLRSSHAEERYAASKALLLLSRRAHTATMSSSKQDNLLRTLGLSPSAVATVYALSFWTDKAVLPHRRARLCAYLLRRYCQRGRYHIAAQLVWNHLCVSCPATRRLFRHSSRLTDVAVLSVCRAVQVYPQHTPQSSSSSSARREQALRHWQGHRALALLRVLAAAGRATPAHCIPLCVAALRCGLPFSAVQRTLPNILVRPETVKWTIDLVRLCMDGHEVVQPMQVPICNKLAHLTEGMDTSTVESSLSSSDANAANDARVVHVCLPHKSKQRALWSLLHGSTPVNRTLATLVTSLYFDDRVRCSVVNCEHWLSHEPPVCKAQGITSEATEDEARIAALSQFYRWEVAASIASCCTTREAYRAMLRALLIHRSDDGDEQSGTSLHQLLASEIDDSEAAPAASEGKASAHCTAHST